MRTSATRACAKRSSNESEIGMPSKSGKQHRLMEMVAHDPKAAKRVGIKQSVGREFVNADKGRHFKGKGRGK